MIGGSQKTTLPNFGALPPAAHPPPPPTSGLHEEKLQGTDTRWALVARSAQEPTNESLTCFLDVCGFVDPFLVNGGTV